MFDEEEEEFNEHTLREDLERFETFLKGGTMGYMDSDRLESMIDHFLINSNYQKAIDCANVGISQFSFIPLFKLRKAQALSSSGRLKEALKLTAEMEQEGESSVELLLTRAHIFSQLRDNKNAIKYYREALEQSSPDERDELYVELAMELENAGDYKTALQVLKDAIRANPNNEGAFYEIAFCYDQLGDFEQALTCYQEFIDQHPYSFTAWYNLGNVYSKMENHEKALWAYEFCLVINEDFGPVYFNMGTAYLSLDQYAEAIEHFKQCMELDGEDALGFCYLGECYEQLSEYKEAATHYRAALKIAPKLPDAWLGLGIVADLEGRTQEAIPYLQRAVELDPENAGIHHVIAGAYEKLGLWKDAEESYEVSLALDPKDGDCLSNYVALLEQTYSLEAAHTFLTAFNERIGENIMGCVIHSRILWRMGQAEKSLALFAFCIEQDREKALEIFELDPDLLNVKEFVTLSS
jgi:tetratricopeptide (TPR) repeat protein